MPTAPLKPTTPIGWIGTGVMGAPMCGHLIDKGYQVTVYNRTRAKSAALLERDAQWCGNAHEVARKSQIIFTMVGFPDDVRAVYLGQDSILAGARPGSIAVDLTTTQPTLAQEIYAAGQAGGVCTIDAPVSGGDVGAREGTLAIMVGGDEQAFETVRPLLELMGKNIIHQGGPGTGQHTKMCNQVTIAGTMIGVCEALLYGRRAGLDLETMLRTISSGAAACWTLDNLAPRILKRNFDPGFFVDHFMKDMGIALEEARRMRLDLPGLELAYELYHKVQDLGHGRCGTHALMLALEHTAQITRTSVEC